MSLDFTIVDVFSDRPFGGNQLAVFQRREAELVAQVRQALGADRLDQAFSSGSRLNQREAVAAVRGRRPVR